MSELHAVTGLVHLRRMDEFIARRREVAARYDKALAGLDGLQPLAEPPGCAQQLSTSTSPCCRRGRPGLVQGANWPAGLTSGSSGEVYDLPLHQQPVLAEYADRPLPVAEDVAARHICLPVHSDMTDDEVDQVLAAVAAVHGELAG